MSEILMNVSYLHFIALITLALPNSYAERSSGSARRGDQRWHRGWSHHIYLNYPWTRLSKTVRAFTTMLLNTRLFSTDRTLMKIILLGGKLRQ